MRLGEDRPSAAESERLSDAVDRVNVLKGHLAPPITPWDTEPTFDSDKDKSQFRKFEDACDRVKAFYAEQHEKQTVKFNIEARIAFHTQKRARMSVWAAMEMLNTMLDASDPDTDVPQIEHLLQTAEAMRRDGKPEWMQIVGLTHDLGKLLSFFGTEGQWAIVGDTFVVGCKFDERVIFHETFAANPDSKDPIYSTVNGVYTVGCGLDNVMLSWGHDEYLYHVFRDQSSLPEEGLAMIRYHSFYPWHREGAYMHFMDSRDYKYLEAVRAFNPYDLYSKCNERVRVAELKPYYENLIAKFFPDEIDW